MKFDVTIMSRKEQWEGKKDSLTIPSADGELTLLYDHAPIMGKLQHGRIKFGGQERRIKKGFFSFNNNKAIVLIDE